MNYSGVLCANLCSVKEDALKKLAMVLILLLCVPLVMLAAQEAGQAPPAKKPPAEKAQAPGAEKAPPAAKKPAAKQEEKTVTTPSGLQYVDLKEGTGAQPKTGDTVQVKYIGRFENGKIFDQSGPKDFFFKLGKGEVIKGWDEGVGTMKVGGRRKLIVPSKLAYGDAGYPGVIPPKSTLIFDVTLVGIK